MTFTPPTTPPPFPGPESTPADGPDGTGQSTKRYVAGGVALAAVVGVGGLLVGSNVVAAIVPTSAGDSLVSATPPTDEAPTDEAPTDETPADDVPSDEVPKDDIDFGEFLPEGLDEELAQLDEQFSAYEACLDEQLGDVFGDFGDFDEWTSTGSVVVEMPGEDGSPLGGFSVYDFGDGDGSVTVTKSGGTITVTSDGDVTTFDESDLKTEFEEGANEWKAAHDACADLLPSDVAIFDQVIPLDDLKNLPAGEFPFDDFEIMFDDFGTMFDDFDVGEFEPGEFPIEDFDLGNFDLGQIDELLEKYDLENLDSFEDLPLDELIKDVEQLFEESTGATQGDN